jgi:predicted MFS family arabinose efflux permease
MTIEPLSRDETSAELTPRSTASERQAIAAEPRGNQKRRLPLVALLALAAACFVTVMTEALPAGLLPQMSTDLGVSESSMGQSVTVFAIGSLLAAIPLTALTAGWPRRRLIVIALIGFVLANAATALSSDFALTLVSRFIGGVVAGLLWALAAGYARRLVSPENAGRAMTIAMAGVPIGFSLGLPAGTLLGSTVGWRISFWLLAALAAVVVLWVLAAVPDFPGVSGRERVSIVRAALLPGVRPVLLVTVLYVLAHNILYTYVAPVLSAAGLAARVDLGLLIFGVLSLVSIGLVGLWIDNHSRALMLLSVILMGSMALALAVAGASAAVTLGAMAVWGLAYGGAATLLQSAAAVAGHGAVDAVQSIVVTIWNAGIAGGAVIGGILLSTAGTTSFPVALLVLLVPAVLVVFLCRGAFPAGNAATTVKLPSL